MLTCKHSSPSVCPGEKFAAGAGQQLALGVSESTIWLGGSIISASMWHGAYHVLSNVNIKGRRLRFAIGLPIATTTVLFGYAIAAHWLPHSPILHAAPGEAQRPGDRSMRYQHHRGGYTHGKYQHSEPNGTPVPDDEPPKKEENQQKWWSRYLFGKKPADKSVEEGTSLKASGYGQKDGE
jgi:hypothetical protein